MPNISLFTLEKIKREAKKLETQFPSMSHGHRLDIAATNKLKVRSYHEARVLCEKHISSFIENNGILSKCSYCHLLFCSLEKGNLKIHNARHLEYEKVENKLGFLPASYDVRESEKKKAYIEMNENSFSMRKKGALRLIRAHFDRSLEAAIEDGYWKNHPTYEKYIAMIEYSDGLIQSDVMRAIREEYGRIQNQMDVGVSDWRPITL